MLKRLLISALLIWVWSITSFSLSGQAYMDRFNTYSAWNKQLPLHATPEFFSFIQEDAPLSRKLREQWLYELARLQDWQQFNTYYQPSQDLNLNCYKRLAEFHLDLTKEALQASKSIWLSGESQPKACNALFDLLLHHPDFDQNLITQRIMLALDRRHVQLALYLLKQYRTPHPTEVQTLTQVHQNPLTISQLKPGTLNAIFYLYGLKRMASVNMDKAIQFWQKDSNHSILDEAQRNAFIAYIALYKALRNHEDTLTWFKQIKPEYFNETLRDWQIRFTLKNHHWKQVEQLIKLSPQQDTPCWQYWLARSLEAQGKQTEAHSIYQKLSQNRQYYGFLASNRLHQSPHFVNESVTTQTDILKPYQPVLNDIQALYRSKQYLQASRLLSDFISELPKGDTSAVVHWVSTQLNWYEKSVYLSNTELLNNQLSLRFPLVYQKTITSYAKHYEISPEFVYAIIRQESSFKEEVISTAGAHGLMQIMPLTAHAVSKTQNIPYNDRKQLFVPEKNIQIGIAYLHQLAQRFYSHPILMAAAYNAGPRQAVHWIRTHPPKEMDLWIETLPWQETRNYLKNILAFYTVYQYRMHQKSRLDSLLTEVPP